MPIIQEGGRGDITLVYRLKIPSTPNYQGIALPLLLYGDLPMFKFMITSCFMVGNAPLWDILKMWDQTRLLHDPRPLTLVISSPWGVPCT